MGDDIHTLLSQYKDNPRDAALCLAIGYEMRGAEHHRALEFLVRAKQLDPEIILAPGVVPEGLVLEVNEHCVPTGKDFFELGAAAYHEGQLESARHLLELQLRVVQGQNAPKTSFMLGDVYEREGNPEKAQHYFLQACKAGFSQAYDRLTEGNKGIFDEQAEKGAGHYDQLFAQNPLFSSRKDLLQAAIQIVVGYESETNSLNILDVGCGTGLFGQLIMRLTGLNYTAYDISAEAIRQAQQRNPGNEDKFYVGSVYNHRIFKGADIVTAFEVLEHVDDFKIIGNIPEGALLVASVPNFDDPAHLRTYSPEIIRERYGSVLTLNPQIQTFSLVKGSKNLEWYLFSGIKTRTEDS